ncbi:MAG TPA: AraC family transcriptional regulator [Gemmatimonadaceae bacterium]|nr:AraC family transcriptional regulator [Gemmatimonadaceae bacterium]
MRTYSASEFAGETSAFLELPGIRFVETHYAAGQKLVRHAHERAHFCLVLEGEYIEQTDSREIVRRTSSIHFQSASSSHGEVHNRCGTHFIIQLAADLLHDADVTAVSRMEMNEAAAVTAVRIHSLIRSKALQEPEVWSNHVWELISFLQHSRLGRPAWVERGREAIHGTYLANLSLSTLASDAGVHPVHFAHTFRKVFGCTAGDYQLRLRVNHACRLLATTRFPISRIAVDTGFADESHLSRCFRRMMLVTPGAYRKSIRGS